MFSILKRFVCPMFFNQWVFLNHPCRFANNGGLDVCNTCIAFICLHECDMDISLFPEEGERGGKLSWRIPGLAWNFGLIFGLSLPHIRFWMICPELCDSQLFTCNWANGADPMDVVFFLEVADSPRLLMFDWNPLGN